MAARKAFFGPPPQHPDLDRLLESSARIPVTDDQLQEQRVSFAYGNALKFDDITKDSVRKASKSMRIVKK